MSCKNIIVLLTCTCVRKSSYNELEMRSHGNLLGFFLFGVYRPTREFFIDMETLALPVKGCKFLPMLGTHGH